MSKIKAHIDKPCSKNWEHMRIGMNSRFCNNCEKNVVDFTDKSRTEILEYLFIHHNKKVCGRVYASQLDFSNSDLLVAINSLSTKHNHSNHLFYLLALGSLLLASCNYNEKIDNPNSKPIDTTISATLPEDTSRIIPKTEKNQLTQPNNTDPIDIIEAPLLGDIILAPETHSSRNSALYYADKMPEFKGGIDSLTRYISQKLKYPEWEKVNKIEGTVYVRFVVDKKGKVKNPEILRTVENAKNFDAQVLKIVKGLPDWIPGEQDGKKVDVQFGLPIRFIL